MNPTEIIPQPNLIVYMKDYTMVTVNSAQYGIVAVIVDISGKEKYPETLKFQWALGTMRTIGLQEPTVSWPMKEEQLSYTISFGISTIP